MEEDAVAFEGTGGVGRGSDDLNIIAVGDDEARRNSCWSWFRTGWRARQ